MKRNIFKNNINKLHKILYSLTYTIMQLFFYITMDYKYFVIHIVIATCLDLNKK